MTRVLVLVGVDVEARGLARHLGLARVEGSRWSHYRGGAIEVVSVGVGAGCLEEHVGSGARPELVVSAGTCGALAPDLGPGDLVVPEVVLTPGGPPQVTCPGLPLARTGTLLTVPAVVATAEDKARLWLATGARAVDMESARVLAWAAALGVPAAVVRAVSDTADRAVPADVAALASADGRVRISGALRFALRRPRRLADAVALGRATAVALGRVAWALGVLARAPRTRA